LTNGAIEDAGADISGESAQVISGLAARNIEQAAEETGAVRALTGATCGAVYGDAENVITNVPARTPGAA
jgi:hypothetical protein